MRFLGIAAKYDAELVATRRDFIDATREIVAVSLLEPSGRGCSLRQATAPDDGRAPRARSAVASPGGSEREPLAWPTRPEFVHSGSEVAVGGMPSDWLDSSRSRRLDLRSRCSSRTGAERRLSEQCTAV